MSFGEIISIAGKYTALGMGIVFGILIFISICIWLLGIICRDRKPAVTAVPETAVSEPQPAEDTGEIAPEIIAVITAAIHQHIKDEQGEAESEGYIVRQVRRATWKHTS